MEQERLIVVGGVAAGMSAASSYKRIKPEAAPILQGNRLLYHL